MSGWRIKSAATLVGLAALALGACAKREAPEAQLLRISQRNEPATLDPHLATLPDEFFVIRALAEGLLVPHPNGGAPLPGAAESWSVSADGLHYTFKLRREARWSNGEPLTARDFLFSFERVLNPALGAPKAALFYAVKNAQAYHLGELKQFADVGFAAPDDYTLTLELAEPAPHLPALAASGPWLPVPRTVVEKSGRSTSRENNWARAGNHVGNGPFVLTEWRKNQHLLVQPNRYYHAAARLHLEGVRFQVYDSGDTEERSFRAGQVDVTMAVPATKLEAYTSPTLRRQPLHETRYLALNLTVPPLNDPRVRRALSLAIDRTALVQNVLRGGQRPAANFVPPGLGDYAGYERIATDPAAARLLLEQAGFPQGANFPRLELTSWGVNPSVLEAIQQMWRRELGIDIRIVQREGKVHMAALLAGDFALAFMPAIPDYDDPAAIFGELTTGATGNFPRWSSPRFDRLVADATRTSDPVRRNALYRDAEETLLAELPVIPLYFNFQNYLVAPRVRDWRQDALWNRYYLDTSLDP
ncbi:MAG: peptide ABC transporter substrate-binding protein [Candidatus Didemnitutus sp.]|nr:peptide ABC transporter substrate-binding protein [Candidatus Didemnitutus sp.]